MKRSKLTGRILLVADRGLSHLLCDDRSRRGGKAGAAVVVGEVTGWDRTAVV